MEIIRSLFGHKFRNLLTICGVAVGVLALTTAGALAEGSNARLDDGARYLGSNVQVGPGAGLTPSLLPLTKIDEIKQVPGVAAAFPTYAFPAKPGAANAAGFGFADTIVASDPTEAAWSDLKTTYAEGHAIDADSSGEVVLGATIDKEFTKKIGDTIDLPVRPLNATSDFVNHAFKVVGILNVTRTQPDALAYINITDGQMLLKDSLPAAVRDQTDVTKVAKGIDVYAKSGTSISELDKIADRINSQVPGVKASKPSDLVNSFKQSGAISPVLTVAAALLAVVVGGLSIAKTMSKDVAAIGELMVKATLLGFIGGVMGYAVGALITMLANASTPPDQSPLFLLTPSLAVLTIGFATVLGACAGVLPAWRAARLRNE